MGFDPLRETGKLLLLLGGVFVVLGLLLTVSTKLPFRLGRLPGDIVWQGKKSTFYFPVVTCLVLSAVLTLVLWVVSLFRR